MPWRRQRGGARLRCARRAAGLPASGAKRAAPGPTAVGSLQQRRQGRQPAHCRDPARQSATGARQPAQRQPTAVKACIGSLAAAQQLHLAEAHLRAWAGRARARRPGSRWRPCPSRSAWRAPPSTARQSCRRRQLHPPEAPTRLGPLLPRPRPRHRRCRRCRWSQGCRCCAWSCWASASATWTWAWAWTWAWTWTWTWTQSAGGVCAWGGLLTLSGSGSESGTWTWSAGWASGCAPCCCARLAAACGWPTWPTPRRACGRRSADAPRSALGDAPS
jgi:hypothetical protein